MLNQWGQTTLHPIGIMVLVVCTIAALSVRREWVLLPVLLLMMAIPSSQRVVIASLDFSFPRIIIIFALARCFIKGERKNTPKSGIDQIVLLWMVWGVFAYAFLIGMSGVITRVGYMIDAVGAYFIGRYYVRSVDDLLRIVKFFGLVAIPTAVLFLIERTTGRNLFAIFGGVPEITLIRDGRLRCQGPYPHPILAGVFWACVLPWLTAFWFGKYGVKARIWWYMACVMVIVLNSASSTPLMAVIFGFIGFTMYIVRRYLSPIRWGIVCMIIALDFVMKAPVYHLISRIDLSGGSTGWHRYNLIHQAIGHLDEWWLFGTLSTRHWGHGLQDVTNQYILEGVRSGLIGMVLFTLMLVGCFRLIGKALAKTNDQGEKWVLWSSGVMVFMHSMNFIAVSYFGQITSAFYLLMGVTISVSASIFHSHETNEKFNVMAADTLNMPPNQSAPTS